MGQNIRIIRICGADTCFVLRRRWTLRVKVQSENGKPFPENGKDDGQNADFADQEDMGEEDPGEEKEEEQSEVEPHFNRRSAGKRGTYVSTMDAIPSFKRKAAIMETDTQPDPPIIEADVGLQNKVRKEWPPLEKSV